MFRSGSLTSILVSWGVVFRLLSVRFRSVRSWVGSCEVVRDSSKGHVAGCARIQGADSTSTLTGRRRTSTRPSKRSFAPWIVVRARRDTPRARLRGSSCHRQFGKPAGFQFHATEETEMRKNRKKRRTRHRVHDGPIRMSPQQHDPVPTHDSRPQGGMRRFMKMGLLLAEVIAKFEIVFKAVHVTRRVRGCRDKFPVGLGRTTNRSCQPRLATLARALGIAAEKIWVRSRVPAQSYRTRFEPKPTGGWRRIQAPFRDLKRLQRKLLRYLSSSCKPHQAATAGIKRASILRHARPHCGERFVVTIDIKGFFDEVNYGQVEFALNRNGMKSDMASTRPNDVPRPSTLDTRCVNRLRGRVAFIRMVQPKLGRELQRQLRSLLTSLVTVN